MKMTRKSISAAQRKKDPHAGPGDSFPLDPEHLRAAWDLAGHAADPDAVREKVLAYARAHGLMDRLPMDARDGSYKKKAIIFKLLDAAQKASVEATDMKKKAQHTALVGKLLNMSYQHENDEGDVYQKERLVMWAQQNGVVGLLPDDAHSFMHDRGLPHVHEGENAKEMHNHIVAKAIMVGVHQTLMVSKAWENEDGTTTFEGWMTTEHRDLQKDIVPPECFERAWDDYFASCAPLSSDHNTDALPVGHLQAGALVRDGHIFKAAKHPSDGHDFEHFPGKGTGAYVRGVVNVPSEAHAVAKGNLGGMSWIGKLNKYEPLPGGGKKYVEVYPLVETTLAAYPVNPHAVVMAAKAFNIPADNSPQETPPTMAQTTQDEALKTLMAALNGETEVEVVTKAEFDQFSADLKAQLETMTAALPNAIGEAVAKAVPAPAPDRNGVGRKGTVDPQEDPRESDPLAYIVAKSRKPDEMTDEDKQLAFGIWEHVLREGMRD